MEFDSTQLMGALEQLEKRVQKDISDTALRKGAQAILEAQEAVAPVMTGKLKVSLAIGKIKGTGAKRKILVGINPASYESVRYGFYQEHGTRVMIGKKWMKRSWINSAGQANKKIGESLAEQLRGR